MLLIQHSRLIQRYIQIPTDNEVVNIKNKKEQTFKWLINLVITLFNDKRVILKNKMSNHLLHLLCCEESAVCGIRHLFCHKKKNNWSWGKFLQTFTIISVSLENKGLHTHAWETLVTWLVYSGNRESGREHRGGFLNVYFCTLVSVTFHLWFGTHSGGYLRVSTGKFLIKMSRAITA